MFCIQPSQGRRGEALLSAREDLFRGVSLTCPDLHHLFPQLNKIPQAEPLSLLHLKEIFFFFPPKYNLGGGSSLTGVLLPLTHGYEVGDLKDFRGCGYYIFPKVGCCIS